MAEWRDIETAPRDGSSSWRRACIRESGRGKFWLNGKRCVAPRASWMLHYGTIPEGLMVLHRCDNPACVRPDHLFLGTASENHIDCVKKRRHGHQKLTVDAVREIRNLGPSTKQRDIAAKFNVSQKTVWLLLQGKTWGHVQ